MEKWQAIIAIATPAVGALFTALWKFLQWIFAELQKARDQYLASLMAMQAELRDERAARLRDTQDYAKALAASNQTAQEANEKLQSLLERAARSSVRPSSQ